MRINGIITAKHLTSLYVKRHYKLDKVIFFFIQRVIKLSKDFSVHNECCISLMQMWTSYSTAWLNNWESELTLRKTNAIKLMTIESCCILLKVMNVVKCGSTPFMFEIKQWLEWNINTGWVRSKYLCYCSMAKHNHIRERDCSLILDCSHYLHGEDCRFNPLHLQ